MLTVNFFKSHAVYFQLIGDYFLLGDCTYGHMSTLKETVEDFCKTMYDRHHIEWEPIDKYLEENKQHYGSNEDWAALASDLDGDKVEDFTIANIMIEQEKGLIELVQSKSPEIRSQVAVAGYCLEVLAKDKDHSVRSQVASRNYNLHGFVKDQHYMVRQAVAMKGYRLDILIKDPIVDVRSAVATQGYKLKALIKDKSPQVRAAVATQGYGLDVLMGDKSTRVRSAVAMQGYGLDVLANDKSERVRNAVKNYRKYGKCDWYLL